MSTGVELVVKSKLPIKLYLDDLVECFDRIAKMPGWDGTAILSIRDFDA
jgi:hypothetical protein